MSTWSYLLVSTLLLVAHPEQQPGPGVGPAVPGDTRFYAVSYVEAMASSSSKAIALLKQYRQASTTEDGFVSMELFEQIGRPGHLAVFEVWRDQKAFETRNASSLKQLRDGLQPVRVSDYDQRPYKTVTLDDRRGNRLQAAHVIVLSHVDVSPNPQVPVMLRELADASRKEAGNVRFDVVQHTARANHFTVVEVWRDQTALDAHVAAPHTRQYRDTLQPLTGSPLDERVYRAIE